MSALSKYDDALATAPARGAGLHQHCMKVARLGVMAGLPPQQVVDEGNNKLIGLRSNEMAQAVGKASNSEVVSSAPIQSRTSYRPQIKPPIDVFTKGQPTDPMELMEASPFRLTDVEGEMEAKVLIETLYSPDDHLFIGDTYTREVKTASEWLTSDLSMHPHIIPNPMTGMVGQTSEGKDSMRCEATVADLRYAVCEMDEVSLDLQVAFWMRCIEMNLPIAAIIHSGSKSLHGWVHVKCEQDAEKWDRDVKGWLFGEFGVRYGFDKACATKARLSRLAGHKRDGKGIQRLLFLDRTRR